MINSLPVYQTEFDARDYGLTPRLPETFDASALKDFVDCPSKFYLRHVLGLYPKGLPEPEYFFWGGKWHKLQEVFNQTLNIADALDYLDPWHPALDVTDKHLRTRDRMRTLFLEYIALHQAEFEKHREVIRQEQFFSISCSEDDDCLYGGCGLTWTGRWDLIARWKKKILVWDYKTTSYLRANYFDQHQHGFQMPGYVWAANHVIPGQVEGARVDLLYTLKNEHQFLPRTLKFSPQAIIEWRENVKTYISEIRRAFEIAPYNPEHPVWRRNWNRCSDYNKSCMFSGLHFISPIDDVRLKIMAQDYIEDRWDPSLDGRD